MNREGGLLPSPVGTRKERGTVVPPLKLLLVSNDGSLIRVIRSLLPGGPRSRIQMQTCDRLTGALARLRYQSFDVVLLDVVLPDCRGIPSVQILARAFPGLPLVVLTEAEADVPGRAAIEAGAQDYLQKGSTDAELLVRTLRFAVQRQRADSALKESQESLETLIENLPDGVVLFGGEGMIYANPAALSLFGAATHAEVQGREVTDFLDCPEDPGLPWRLEQVLRGERGSGEFREGRCLRADGGPPAACQFMAVPLHKSHGVQGQLILRDMTRQKQADQRLRQATAVFESSGEGMMILDAGGRVEMVNAAFSEITGFPGEEAVGRHCRFLEGSGNGQGFFRGLSRILTGENHWRGEICARCRDGTTFIARMAVSVIREDDGRVINYIGGFNDATEEKRREAAVASMANHDTLTGLPTRRLLLDRLTQALADRRRAAPGHDRLALFFVDLDGFKRINDVHGHEGGDLVLREVAQRMQASLRAGDTVARFGGDEFLVLVKHLPGREAAGMQAEKLLRVIADPIPLGAEADGVTMGASIGIAMAPEHGDQGDLLINRADQAMYRCKGSREPSVCFF